MKQLIKPKSFWYDAFQVLEELIGKNGHCETTYDNCID